MDPTLDLEARRLFVSTALTTQALRRLRGRVPPDSDAGGLLALARRLGKDAAPVERRYGLRFDPPYPGVTAGAENAGGNLRLVLACIACLRDGNPLGVVFTALIPGRKPQVSVAPVEAGLPGGWRPLNDLL